MVHPGGRAVLIGWAARLGLVLLAAEAALVGAAVLLPRASPAYRAVYLDHTRDCWAASPATLPPQDTWHPAALAPAAACALLPQGWNPADAFGVWSNGPVAQVDIPLRLTDRRAVLLFRGYAPARPQTVGWVQQGGPAGTLALPPGATVALTVAGPPGGTIQLRLQIADVHRPTDTDVPDWRAIGVALLQIDRSP